MYSLRKNKWVSLLAGLVFLLASHIAYAETWFPGYVVSESGYQVGSYDSTTRTTVISSSGELTNAVAKTDAIAFLGIPEFSFLTGTWTVTRNAGGNYSNNKTAGDTTSYLHANISNVMRTATSKGLKLTSLKYIYSNATADLDAHTLQVFKTTYADNTAVAIDNVTSATNVGIAQQAAPEVQTVTVSSPAFQNTDLAKWIIEITVDAAASSVYKFYGVELLFTYDPL